MKFTVSTMIDGMMALLPLETMTTGVLTEAIEVEEEVEEVEAMIRVGGFEGAVPEGVGGIVDIMIENVDIMIESAKILVAKEVVLNPSRERTDSKSSIMYLLLIYY